MNHYEVLGLTKSATQEEISKAYRKLSRKHHPDMHENSDDQEKHAKKFKDISEAYSVIGDESKRINYDRGGFQGTQRNRGPFAGGFNEFFTHAYSARRMPVGDHITVKCIISLEEVLTGATKKLDYAKKTLCDTCDGRGGLYDTCDECDGTGIRTIFGENMNVRANCTACRDGLKFKEKCSDCQNGFGSIEKCSIDFKVVKGVDSKMRFVHRGLGHPCNDPKGQPGNLYVVIEVINNPLFHRDERSLHGKISLSYTQLVLGDDVVVPTIDGEATLKIPAGTKPDQKFKLSKMGLPGIDNRGRSYPRGDQFVTIDLDVPKELSEEHKIVIEKLREFEE